MPETLRYLGLELSGAKNQKTALAVIEYYPKERKTFLLDVFDKIAPHSDQTSDQALIELIREETGNDKPKKMGVNVPLTLPPCLSCSPRSCSPSTSLAGNCGSPSVRWMNQYIRKVSHAKNLKNKINPFTPYTQRPFELWARYELLNRLPKNHFFEIDEALGGNRAPLTARMHFLKKQLRHFPLCEVWPKLTVAFLSQKLALSPRVIRSYRLLEQGAHFRELILNAIAKQYEVFIYERDLRKLAQSLTGFDAFLCAFTVVLSDRGECAKVPKGFPEKSGWVCYPEA
ncbi:MAG: hypothetical protein HYX41_02715 [Bdellovibrio sp.]|nr:hypothetical protein [Bdellovibrio sp.]